VTTPSSPPPRRVRFAGRAITTLVARAPWTWRLLRGRQQRFFDALAPTWGAASDESPPLSAALDALDLQPRRVLDVGTGRGRGARELARRYPEAEVLGIDISGEMIRNAEVPGELAGRLRFAEADLTALDDSGFDLVVQVNVPVFFADLARVTAPGGHVVLAATFGARTPYFTPHSVLRRGFRRVGMKPAGEGEAGPGTWFAARLP
jgi:SAM-dependent methyltransferase